MTRLVLITPARNEASHIERTAAAVAAQTRRPDRWLVVDDGSSDETPACWAASKPSCRSWRCSARRSRASRRLATGWPWPPRRERSTGPRSGPGRMTSPTSASSTATSSFLPTTSSGCWPASRSGLVSVSPAGTCSSPVRAAGSPPASRPTTCGALKLYSSGCLEEIGGVEERLGWDTIDETYARMRGSETRSFDDLVARHHRPVATADGALRGRARHGECAYIAALRARVGCCCAR